MKINITSILLIAASIAPLLPVKAIATNIVGNNVVGAFSAGHSTIAGGTDAVALVQSYVDADLAFAAGNSFAFGLSSVALGNSGCEGDYATASGYSNANQYCSVALGGSLSEGQFATALGNSEADGDYSTSMGGSTFATGKYSTAMGNYTISNGYAQLVIGQFNVAAGNGTSPIATDALFIIGNGASNTARSNAFTVRRNGAVLIKPSGDLSMGTFTTGPQP